MKDYSVKKGVKKSSKDGEATSQYSKSYVIWLVIGVLIFIPTLLIARKHQLSGFQLHIFRDLNNLSNSFKTPALVLTEGLGAGYAIALCVLIAALFKRYKLAWRFFFAAGASGVFLEIGKKIAKEPRPTVILHNNLHVRAVETGLNSYPSGHETMATALALTLWLVLPKKWRWVSIFWIVLVAVSRIYVGDHTPNDVLGGFACGLIVICVLRLLPQKFAKKVHLDTDDSLLEKGF